MRKIFWNIYAWPLSVLVVATFFMIDEEEPYLSHATDMILSALAIIGLHLHIWNKKVCTPLFWKMFVIIYILWDFLYNILLEPLYTREAFDATLLYVTLALVPLYIALFQYAFTSWTDAEEIG